MYPWFYQPDHIPYFYPQVKIQEGQYFQYESPPTKIQPTVKIEVEIKQQEEIRQEKKIEASNPLIRSRKVQKKKKQQKQDEEYEIDLENEIREDWKKKIRQNRTRNFYSTIFRIFLRKTCVEKGKKNEEQKIRNIIQKYNLSITVDQIMKVLHKKNKILKSYMKVKEIKKFFKQESEEMSLQKTQLSKVLRILMERYLRQEFFFHYTVSKNIREGNTTLYLETSRKFTEIFLSS